MQDFKLKAVAPGRPGGRVVIRVHNRGPSTHEINVDRTDLAAACFR